MQPFVIRMAPPPPRPAQRVADCAYNALHGRGASSAAVASALLRGAGGAASPPPHPAQRAAEWRGNASGGGKDAHLKMGARSDPPTRKGLRMPARQSGAQPELGGTFAKPWGQLGSHEQHTRSVTASETLGLVRSLVPTALYVDLNSHSSTQLLDRRRTATR